MNLPRLSIVLGTIALTLSGAATARADLVGAAPTTRYVFKQQLPLQLDFSRVAVHAPDATPADVIAAAITAAGLDPATLKPTVLNGWSMLSIPPAPAGSPVGVDGYVAALASQPGLDFASPVFLTADGESMWVAGDLLAGFDPALKPEDHDTIVNTAAKILSAKHEWILHADRFTLDTHNGYAVLAAANALSLRPDVVFAEPNWALTGKYSLIPNDTFFSTQWGLHNTGQSGGVAGMDIKASEAWDITQGASTIFIAVLDGGVELTHPDLNVSIGLSIDEATNATGGNPGNTCDNHGTPVAGCISAKINNSLGVAGVAPGCKVVSIRDSIATLDMPCTTGYTSTGAILGSSIDYARSVGCRVTNSSKGYPVLAITETAYQTCYNNGVVNFAEPTGNAGVTSIDYPASSAYVLGVGAIDRTGTLASFSNTGAGVAFVAPGLDISVTDRTGASGYTPDDYANLAGTSFASPIAAGVAALMLSVNPNMTAAQVGTVMKNTAVDRGVAGYDTSYGYGIVNAFAALNALPPLNDNCASAIDVSSGGTFMGTLVNALNDGTGSCGLSGPNPDVWYTFTNGSCPMLLTVSTCGTNDTPGVDQGMDTVLSLFSSCGGTELACNDDSVNNACGEAGLTRDSLITRQLAPGESVLIRVSKFGAGFVGPFRLNVGSSLANDACVGALAIAPGVPTPFCNTAASTDGPAESLCLNSLDSNISHDLWYRYQAHTVGRFTARTCGSNFDTKVGIYPNACPGAPGTILACNDDANVCGAGSVQSSVSWMGSAGTSYLIRVGGFTTHTGSGILEVFCPADYDFSGGLALADIFAFLNDWFAGNLSTDFDGSGGLAVADIFAFLNAWFSGC